MTSQYPSEAQITKTIMTAHKAYGVPGTRIVSIPNAFAHGQPGLTKGVPDLLVVSPALIGGMALLELKAEGGRVSPDQLAFGSDVVAAGGLTRVAWGLDDALEVLTHWGALRKVRRAA